MSIWNLKITGSLILLASSAGSALAGVGSTGGGNAVVCDHARDHMPRTIELLDLYEARLRGATLIQETDAPEQQLKYKIAHLSKISLPKRDSLAILSTEFTLPYLWFESGIDGAWRIVHKVNDAFVLPDLHDSGALPTLPTHCRIERLAYFEANGNVYIRESLFDALDNTNKGALLLHEFLYRGAREAMGMQRVPDSQDVRYMVGALYSNLKIEKRFIDFPTLDDSVALCSTPDGQSSYFLYPAPSNKTSARYRQEHYVSEGRFHYRPDNIDVGTPSAQDLIRYSKQCQFIVNRSAWHP